MNMCLKMGRDVHELSPCLSVLQSSALLPCYMQCWGVVSVHREIIFLEGSQAFPFPQVFHEFIFGRHMVQFKNCRKEQPWQITFFSATFQQQTLLAPVFTCSVIVNYMPYWKSSIAPANSWETAGVYEANTCPYIPVYGTGKLSYRQQ